MHLNISQAASLLGTSEEMLIRWARQGAIPAIEADGTFHFKRQALESWAARRRMPLRNVACDTTENPVHTTSILDAVATGGFYYNVKGKDAPSLLENLILNLNLQSVDRDILLQRVIEREALSPTGIGNGIAIPHPRQPIESLDKSVVVTCFPEHPVSFGALDGQPVSIVFLVLSIDTKTHLTLLSQLSFVLQYESNAMLFRSAPEPAIILKQVELACRHISG
ncbi:MAG: PTS sugar transporter subunit IIA [Deltaproteobacteria bacterium]|nr:PTS sugar transporter subunit IIA [Deltaproteobacteria bacterium]